MDIGQILTSLSVIVIPLLFAVTLHEAAHGWVAWKLGDSTAKMMGRVTFNPIKHIDPFGTIILPGLMFLGSMGLSGNPMLFGFAKPVPVNFRALKNPRRDMILVALAGPGTNFLLAVISAAGFYAVDFFPDTAKIWLQSNLGISVWINCLLCVFNMLPIPPLDGGRVAVGLLPQGLAYPLARLERYGIFIVLGLFFVLPWLGGKLGLDLSFILRFVMHLTELLADLAIMLVGIR